MYFPNTIEEVCYDENHIDTVEKALKERFDMIINHLEKRGSKTDMKTVEFMKIFKDKTV